MRVYHAAGAAMAAGVLVVLVCAFLEGFGERGTESRESLMVRTQQEQVLRAGGPQEDAWETDDTNAFAGEHAAVEHFPSVSLIPPGLLHSGHIEQAASIVQRGPQMTSHASRSPPLRLHSTATHVEKAVEAISKSKEEGCRFDQPEMIAQEFHQSVCALHLSAGAEDCARFWSEVRLLQGDSVGCVLQQEKDWDPKFRNSFSQLLYKVSAPAISQGSGSQMGYVTSGYAFQGPLATWIPPREGQAGATVASCQPVGFSWNMDYLGLSWWSSQRIPFAVKDCAGEEIGHFEIDCRSHPLQRQQGSRSLSALNLAIHGAIPMLVEEEVIRGSGGNVLGWQLYITGSDGEGIGTMIRMNSANKGWILQVNREGGVDLRLLVMIASILDFTFYKKGKRRRRTMDIEEECEQRAIEESDVTLEHVIDTSICIEKACPDREDLKRAQEHTHSSSADLKLDEAIFAIEKAIDKNNAMRNSWR
eukprot:757384-Hanusia_phi.AAC.1